MFAIRRHRALMSSTTDIITAAGARQRLMTMAVETPRPHAPVPQLCGINTVTHETKDTPGWGQVTATSDQTFLAAPTIHCVHAPST